MAAAQVASHPIETVEESGSKKVRAIASEMLHASEERCFMVAESASLGPHDAGI